MSNKTFSSSLAPWLQGFLEEKRSNGFKYDTEEQLLSLFDRYWREENGAVLEISQDTLQGWIEQRPTEGKSFQAKRIGVIKQFTLYLTGLGIKCWIPDVKVRFGRPVQRVLSLDEIHEFFSVVDHYTPLVANRKYRRIAREYPVFFRLQLTTGMRPGEACALRIEDVNLDKRHAKVLGGKRNKDRLVYLSEDMCQLLDDYLRAIQSIDPEAAETWLFPGLDPRSHLSLSIIEQRFKMFWKQTAFFEPCKRFPTPHSLRHTYVVLRINKWAAERRDFQVMMPYLSRQLGHASPEQTYYYFHAVYEGLEQVRRHDSAFSTLFPEVKPT